MPSYQFSLLNRHIPQAVPGLPVYLLGSRDYIVAPTVINITAVALAGTTATVTGTLIEGNIPVAGQKVSIAGVTPSYFNVTDAPILASTFDLSTGIGTFTFTLNNSNIGTTAATGRAMATTKESSDSLTAGASLQCALQANTGPDNEKAIRFDVSFPTLPGGVTVVAQTANRDEDSEYVTLGTVASVAAGVQSGGSVIFTGVIARFVRFYVSGIIGVGSATIIGKVTV